MTSSATGVDAALSRYIRSAIFNHRKPALFVAGRVHCDKFESELLQLCVDECQLVCVKHPVQLVLADLYPGYLTVVAHTHLPHAENRLNCNLGALYPAELSISNLH